MTKLTRIIAYYDLSEDKEKVYVSFTLDMIPAGAKCFVNISNNDEREYKQINILSEDTTEILAFYNKEILIFKVAHNETIIAGGLYQIEIQHGNLGKYIMFSICEHGIMLLQTQDPSVREMYEDGVADELELLEDWNRDAEESVIENLGEMGLTYRKEGGCLHIFPKSDINRH